MQDTTMLVLVAAAGVGAVLLVLAARMNQLMLQTPPRALKLVGEPVTQQRAGDVFEKVAKKRIDFGANRAAKQERRYVIIGGTGLLGAQIALDLIDGGTPAKAIRLIDIRAPFREEFTSGRASKVLFAQADTTSEASISKAFAQPWADDSVAKLPLTVFLTAAVIRPYERHELFYDRCLRVNVVGTANSLAAARTAGTSIFIYTSSSQASTVNTDWFSTLWLRSSPSSFDQDCSEKDFFEPLRPLAKCANIYSRSKAEAERLVCDADDGAMSTPGSMRTGCIRPGNAVYGDKDDHVIGRILESRTVPTFSAPWVQNWVYVRNVSHAHLLLESALLGEHVDKVAAKPFMVTDNGPPVRFQDVYNVLSSTASTGLKVYHPPPLLLLLVSYGVEAYCLLLARLPFLKSFLSEPGEPLCLFQPGIFSSTVSQTVDDSRARLMPSEGGLGYRGYCDTVEGLCTMVSDWNKWIAKTEGKLDKF